MTAPLLVGTHFYPGGPEELRRQARVMDALRDLPGVTAVDLQWQDQPAKRPWIRTVPALRRSSVTVTGHAGRTKPLMADMFAALADEAARIGSRFFVFFNADIALTAEAVALIRAGAHQVYAFTRMNHDRDGRDLGMYLKGLDAFAIDVAWWRANRRRFRPYIVGERSWDNSYGAIAMCHADAVIVNRDPVTRHEAHPIVWGSGPFDVYNRYLTALDFRYFTMWGEYHRRLIAARARGASADEEREIARAVFVWRRSLPAATMQAARSAKAWVRYRAQRRGWTLPARPATVDVQG